MWRMVIRVAPANAGQRPAIMADCRVLHGEAIEFMRMIPDDSVDAIVTDPDYELIVHPKIIEWGGVPKAEWAAQALRVLKPGGHLLAFGGTRTYHRLATAIEDAGFEIRDSLAWLYGGGWPKSHDVSKAIDKAAGAEREVIGTGKRSQNRSEGWDRPWMHDQMDALGNSGMAEHTITAPATDEAKQWEGWGTALKPAFEPIVVARKPFKGTVVANVLAHGTGGINIDGCRIGDGTDNRPREHEATADQRYDGMFAATPGPRGGSPKGRWPANVILNEDAAAQMDEQTGVLKSGYMSPNAARSKQSVVYGDMPLRVAPDGTYADSGGASRFFYTAKASQRERPIGPDGTKHPTVKPLSVIRWLVRLVTPPGGMVLDPFAGSGTTAEAAILEGVNSIVIEREPTYWPLIDMRIERARNA